MKPYRIALLFVLPVVACEEGAKTLSPKPDFPSITDNDIDSRDPTGSGGTIAGAGGADAGTGGGSTWGGEGGALGGQGGELLGGSTGVLRR